MYRRRRKVMDGRAILSSRDDEPTMEPPSSTEEDDRQRALAHLKDTVDTESLKEPLLGSGFDVSIARPQEVQACGIIRSIGLFFVRMYHRVLDTMYIWYRRGWRRTIKKDLKISRSSSSFDYIIQNYQVEGILMRNGPWCDEQVSLLTSRLDELHRRAQVTYNEEQHIVYLKRLWEVAFSDKGEIFPSKGVRHPLWKDLGWQSDDPGRDIRGGGALALELLVFFAEQETDTFMILMNKGKIRDIENYYPFAAASVVVTKTIVDMLHLSRDSSMRVPHRITRSPAEEGFVTRLLPVSEHALEYVFIETMVTLDEVWDRRNLGYLNFKSALTEIQMRLKRILERRWLSSLDHLGTMRSEYS